MTDIPVDGVEVGHWTDPVARTGCTVVLVPDGSVASYECRGGAPAARELTPLEPDKTVSTVDAVVLTGGSAFGLASADGVMRRMEELERGVPTPGGRVPIVPALGLFDLAVGDGAVRPGAEQGYAAARCASHAQPATGQVGAGTGAAVGHWRGPEGRRPGGIGTATCQLDEVTVWALVVVNAFGDIDTGGGEVELAAARALHAQPVTDRAHTTIGVVVTNARLSPVECRIVAQGGHDGLARAITPPHTRFDGDALVAVSAGVIPAHVDVVRLLALAAVADAIRDVGASAAPLQ